MVMGQYTTHVPHHEYLIPQSAVESILASNTCKYWRSVAEVVVGQVEQGQKQKQKQKQAEVGIGWKTKDGEGRRMEERGMGRMWGG